MSNKENLMKQMELTKQMQEKHYEDLEKTRKLQLELLSPTYDLIKQSNVESSQNNFLNLQQNLMGINDSSLDAYEHYRNSRSEIHEQMKKLIGTDNLQKPFQSVLSIEKTNNPTPLELLLDSTFSKEDLNENNEIFHDIDWTTTINESTMRTLDSDLYSFNFVTKSPEEFASKLHQLIEEIDDESLKTIFNTRFLNEITKSWWIIPRLELSEYVKLSEREATNNDLNQLLIGEFYLNPEKLYSLVNTWDFEDESRAKIIMQAFDNYYNGNYEICVLTLLLQIEGLMRDKLKLTHTGGKLRQKLEEKLDAHIETLNNENPYYHFLVKSFKLYLWMILNPLDDDVDFIEDETEINRNISAHVGKIEADQVIAIRLFLIIDTLMFILSII